MAKDTEIIIEKLDQILELLSVQSVKIDEVKQEAKRPVFNPVGGGKKVK